MIKKIAFLILIIFSAHQMTRAENVEELKKVDSLLVQAQNQYDQGYFSNVIELYSGIVQKGFVSTELYYNLGNAYFKTGNYPYAILNYERAIKINSNNQDAIINLKIANTKIQDDIKVVPEFFLKKWWTNFVNIFSSNSWAIIAIMLFIVTLFFVGFFLVSRIRGIKKLSFILGSVTFLFFFFSVGASLEKLDQEKNQSMAIIIQASITIKSSPTDNNSTDLFVLHEGTKVEITDKVDHYYKIRIANGSIGWMPKKGLEII